MVDDARAVIGHAGDGKRFGKVVERRSVRATEHQGAGNPHRAQGIEPIRILHNFRFKRLRQYASGETVRRDCVLDRGDMPRGIRCRAKQFPRALSGETRC